MFFFPLQSLLYPKREKGQNQYQSATEKIKHIELEGQKAAEAQKAMEQELQLHKVMIIKVKVQKVYKIFNLFT